MSEVRSELDDPRAIAFIQKSLGVGHSVSQAFLRLHDLSVGHVHTYLPMGVSANESLEFDEGIFPTTRSMYNIEPIRNLDHRLESEFETYLEVSDSRVVLIEDNSIRASSPVLAKGDLRLVVFEQEVYYLLTNDDVGSGRSRAAMRTARSWVLNCFLVDGWCPSIRSTDRYDLQGNDIANIATHTTSVVVGAFDYEGFLIWSLCDE